MDGNLLGCKDGQMEFSDTSVKSIMAFIGILCTLVAMVLCHDNQ